MRDTNDIIFRNFIDPTFASNPPIRGYSAPLLQCCKSKLFSYQHIFTLFCKSLVKLVFFFKNKKQKQNWFNMIATYQNRSQVLHHFGLQLELSLRERKREKDM